MDYLSLKKAIFFPDKIVILKKKSKVIIDINSIERIEYAKPTLLNYIFATVLFGGICPGRLEIHLKDNIFTRHAYHTKLFLIKIKYKDYLKLPEIYSQKFMLKQYN